MKKRIKLLLFVGIGSAVVKVAKALLHGHDGDRPPIRVRNGGSIHVTTERGDFVHEDGEFRQRHKNTTGPRTLRVCIRHADKTTTFAGRSVRIVYRVGGQKRRLTIDARKRYLNMFSDHVYVGPDGDASVEHSGAALALEMDQATELLHVAVSGGPEAGSVTFEDGDKPEIDIHPRS